MELDNEWKINFSRGRERELFKRREKMDLQEVKKNNPSTGRKNKFSIGEEYRSSIGEEYMHLFKKIEHVPSIGTEHKPLQEEEKYVTLQ